MQRLWRPALLGLNATRLTHIKQALKPGISPRGTATDCTEICPYIYHTKPFRVNGRWGILPSVARFTRETHTIM